MKYLKVIFNKTKYLKFLFWKVYKECILNVITICHIYYTRDKTYLRDKITALHKYQYTRH